jgi:hypothetical protein
MKQLLLTLLVMVIAGCAKSASPTPAETAPESGRATPPAAAAPKLSWREYPRLSPFEAVRWRESVPEVRVRGDWYELLSLNGLEAKQVVAFAKKLDKKDWQKRFEEDLMEVLIRMGHEPGKSATLQVRRLDSGITQVLKDVPLTEENRRAIWEARHRQASPPRRP